MSEASPSLDARAWREHGRVFSALGIVSLAIEHAEEANDDAAIGALRAVKALLNEATNNLAEIASDLLPEVAHE